MTKSVRIENADMNTHVKLRVRLFRKGHDGQPDVEDHSQELIYPTQMLSLGIYDETYLVIDELPNGP
jgi:hypothetical protein